MSQGSEFIECSHLTTLFENRPFDSLFKFTFRRLSRFSTELNLSQTARIPWLRIPWFPSGWHALPDKGKKETKILSIVFFSAR